jgi:release factor glutamine methyltransferase
MANDIDTALRQASKRLGGISDTPRIDAELLMAHALGLTRGDMLLKRQELELPQSFPALIDRRAAGEPIAYIQGQQEFWGIRFVVTPDVLIPRSDSETLIEAAQIHFANTPSPQKILDLGTGSGALLLTALSLFPDATGVAIDASAGALSVARSNSQCLGLQNRTDFFLLNWREAGWANGLGKFDLILCNPPYVQADAMLSKTVRDFEPASALFAGPEGLDDYRILIPQMSDLLTPNGLAIFEIGQGQDAAVTQMAKQVGFWVKERRDLAGIIRVLSLSKSAGC